MGICFSSKSSYSSSSSSFDCIRIVNLNGFVEDFEAPTTVKQITLHHPKHYVCTMAQLLPSSKQFPPDTLLQPGKLYFLLPFSLFQSETSPANMVAIATRLASIANKYQSKPAALQKDVVVNKGGIVVKNYDGFKVYQEQKSSEGSWKPILDSIIEKSMEYRCESDLVSKLGR